MNIIPQISMFGDNEFEEDDEYLEKVIARIVHA